MVAINASMIHIATYHLIASNIGERNNTEIAELPFPFRRLLMHSPPRPITGGQPISQQNDPHQLNTLLLSDQVLRVLKAQAIVTHCPIQPMTA